MRETHAGGSSFFGVYFGIIHASTCYIYVTLDLQILQMKLLIQIAGQRRFGGENCDFHCNQVK